MGDEMRKICVRIFFKSKETDITLKPVDVNKVTKFFIKERILCLVQDNNYNVCIPIENILYYEMWWEDENGTDKR